MTFVVPGFRITRPSKICSVTRNDSPSETSAGSRYVGSDAPANTKVGSAFDAPPAVPTAASAARATSGRTSRLIIPLIDELLPARPPWRVRHKYARLGPLGLGRSANTLGSA